MHEHACKGVHTHVPAHLPVGLTCCHCSPCPGVCPRYPGCGLQPRHHTGTQRGALLCCSRQPSPVTGPQGHSAGVWSPSHGVREQRRAPCQGVPLWGCPRWAHPEPPAPSWSWCAAPAVRQQSPPLRRVRRCQPPATALGFDSPASQGPLASAGSRLLETGPLAQWHPPGDGAHRAGQAEGCWGLQQSPCPAWPDPSPGTRDDPFSWSAGTRGSVPQVRAVRGRSVTPWGVQAGGQAGPTPA